MTPATRPPLLYHGDHGSDPFILSEAIASQDLWMWHAFFGIAGLNNDVNVIRQSPYFNDLKSEKAPDVLFVANDMTYKRGYYLMKSIPSSGVNETKRTRYKNAHEATGKDVERVFGVLKKKLSKWLIPKIHFKFCVQDFLRTRTLADWPNLSILTALLEQPVDTALMAEKQHSKQIKKPLEVACNMLKMSPVSSKAGKADKNKQVVPYQPKPKPNPLKRKENPNKDQACHHCHVAGHWKRNCPLYIEELRANKKKSEGRLEIVNSWILLKCVNVDDKQLLKPCREMFDLVLPSGLVLKLNNCYYAPSIVRGVVSLSCLLDLGFHHTIASNGISVSLNGKWNLTKKMAMDGKRQTRRAIRILIAIAGTMIMRYGKWMLKADLLDMVVRWKDILWSNLKGAQGQMWHFAQTWSRSIITRIQCTGGNPDTELEVTGFCDASWQCDKDDTKSQTGYVFVVKWRSSRLEEQKAEQPLPMHA
ncbi:retrotransposon protein, putative, ty1-copia subclass [Tanacetum coccineum]